jgi:hypothetical protein
MALAKEKNAVQYGMGVIVNVPFPEADVLQVVQDITQNGIIRGTMEYSKDDHLTGATVATSTPGFKEWTEGGKVFYKIRAKALDPWNFKSSGDTGTVAVRYVVQSQDDKHTVLHIDAVYVDDIHHSAHASNGSVEGGEYKDIHDRLEAIESMKEQTLEAEKEKRAYEAKLHSALMAPSSTPDSSTSSSQPVSETAPPAAIAPPDISAPAVSSQPQPQAQPQTLEQRVKDLRHQVERLVKSPGAPLKSAPFHTASTLQSLPPGTEVVVEISTRYWLGVETHGGQRGWILRDELEQAP